MSCPGGTGATTRPAPVRVRSPAPSPEPKIRCLSPRLVDEDVVMFECEKELEPPQASVGLGIPHAILEHATVSESAACLRPVVAGSNVPACPTAIALAEVDTHSDEAEGEEWEEWEEDEEEEEGEIDHDLPSSTSASTGSCSLFNNRAKLAQTPSPRAAPAPDPLRFERPAEVQVPPPTLAPSGPTGIKIENETEDDGLWIRGEPTRIPGPFPRPPDRLGSESAASGGHPESTSERTGTSKGSSGSRGTEPGRAQPEPEGEHEISINLATGAETASLELHLTSGSIDTSREHSAAPTSEPTFNLKVTTKGPGRFSVSAAWERGGSR